MNKMSSPPSLILKIFALFLGGSLACWVNVTAAMTTGRSDLRPLSAEFTSLKAVAYSGYRGSDHRSPPTPAQVLEDLQLLSSGGFKLIRTFGSDDFDTGVILKTIHDHPELGIKMQLGIWISGSKATSDSANRAQIAKGIAYANKYPEIILAVSIGNEALVDWSLHIPPVDLINYIKTVRARIAQPVTTDDNWAVFANVNGQYKTKSLLNAIDFVALHSYPLSDSIYDPSFAWKNETVAANLRANAMMDAMIAKTKADFAAVKAYMKLQKVELPIIIGEAGWKAVGEEHDRDHAVNQKMYYDRLMSWKDGPRQIFYFEAFDEPWKQGDNGWGLFDVNRKARYVIHDLYPISVQDGSMFTEADAVYFGTQTARPRVKADRYYLFSDTVSPGWASPAGADTSVTLWKAWDTPASTSGRVVINDAPEGRRAFEISPKPNAGVWGYSINLPNPVNLSNFNNEGARLNFSIKTTYTGSLDVGFSTASRDMNKTAAAYLQIAHGDYGYQNDGTWHSVSIPIATIVANAISPDRQARSGSINTDLVTSGFVIADRFASIATSGDAKAQILIDNVYWSMTPDTTLPAAAAPIRFAFDEPANIAMKVFGSSTTRATFAADPAGGGGRVVKFVKAADAVEWAGVRVSTAPNDTIPVVVFSTTNRIMTVRVYSPAVGTKFRLKLEESTDGNHSVETDAVTSVANTWETLSFNFDNNSGTSAYTTSYKYNRLSVFPNFGVLGAKVGVQTYYFDDIQYTP